MKHDKEIYLTQKEMWWWLTLNQQLHFFCLLKIFSFLKIFVLLIQTRVIKRADICREFQFAFCIKKLSKLCLAGVKTGLQDKYLTLLILKKIYFIIYLRFYCKPSKNGNDDVFLRTLSISSKVIISLNTKEKLHVNFLQIELLWQNFCDSSRWMLCCACSKLTIK